MKGKLFSLIPQSAMVYKEGKFYIYHHGKDGKNSLKEIKHLQLGVF